MSLKDLISYQTPEGEGEGGENDGDKSSLNVFLDDDSSKVKEESKKDDETEDEEIKEENTDEKEEEEKEEELTLARVDYTELKKEFPDLFKKYPDLKHAFFREQEFTEVFPTVEDAKAASEKAAAYDEITDAVLEGNATKFIAELGSTEGDGLKKFASSFLPSLLESNKDIFYDAVSPVVAQFLKNVYDSGKKRGGDEGKNIENAAKIVRKILFDGDYDDIEKISNNLNEKKEKSAEEKKFEEEKAKYLGDKYNTLYAQVTESCYKALDSEISKGLEDLKGKPGLQKLVAEKIRNEVLSEMDKDSAYLSRLTGIWKIEQRLGFNGSKKDSIKTAFVAKAKGLVPKIRARVRSEVIGKEDVKKDDEKREPNRPDVGRNSAGKGERMTPEKVKKENLSTRAIFD